MKTYLFIEALLLSILVHPAFTKDNPSYKVSLINQELKKNAKAVIRKDETILEVHSNYAIEKHVYAITFLQYKSREAGKTSIK